MPSAALALAFAATLAAAVGSGGVGSAAGDRSHGEGPRALMRAQAAAALAALQSADPPPRHYARAADPGRPLAYVGLRSRDLAFAVNYAGDLMGADLQLAAENTRQLLRSSPASAAGEHTSESSELASRGWLLAGIANRTGGKLICDELPALWSSLRGLYDNTSRFRDGLAFSALPTVTGLDTVMSSGHDTLLSLQHVQALDALAGAAQRWGCGGGMVAALREAQSSITTALRGPLLENRTTGMFRPSSGNNAELTDVWGSALAVDLGAVAGEREKKIVAWFGEFWPKVFQDGQVRHLPLVFGSVGGTPGAGGTPVGEYFPNLTTWAYQTHSNGGYWAEASGWVLPVLARNNSVLAAGLLQQAIRLAQKEGGLSEWANSRVCCNCEINAPVSYILPRKCMTLFPTTASLRGAAHYGRSVFSVYAAAKRMLPAAGETSASALASHESHDVDATTLHNRASVAVARASHAGASGASDPGLEWLSTYVSLYQAEARECTGCKNCLPPPYEGCGFPPAADPGRPGAYSVLWTRDFTYTMETMYPLFDAISRQAALNQTLYIMNYSNSAATYTGNCSVKPGVCSIDEPLFQVKMVVGLANHSGNRALFCGNVEKLWTGLRSVYENTAAWKNDLLWSPGGAYGFTDSIGKSEAHLFLSVLHYQACKELAEMADKFRCGDAVEFRKMQARIGAALAGPVLWNETSGMFRPSSGDNCFISGAQCVPNSQLTDVWGSALAVDVGAVVGERAARIVAWFGAHWPEVVQGGQVRHLAKGEHWPSVAFVEYLLRQIFLLILSTFQSRNI